MQPDNSQIGEHFFDLKITDNQGNSQIKSVTVEVLESDKIGISEDDVETLKLNDDSAVFTASTEKWLADTDGFDPKWMDGPSIKLYKKDDLQSETITHVVTVDTGTNDYRTNNSVLTSHVNPSTA